MRKGAVPPTDDAELVLYRLMLVSGFVSAEFARRFGRHRLALPDWRVLLELHREGADTAADIARRTGLTAMTVSRSVATLLGQRRVQRTTDPADARRRLLALTPRGRAVIARVLPEGEALAHALLQEVPPARRAALAEALGAMLDAARRGADAGVRSRTDRPPARRAS
jgi:DNA-binding MarR family transcriptional regulator